MNVLIAPGYSVATLPPGAAGPTAGATTGNITNTKQPDGSYLATPTVNPTPASPVTPPPVVTSGVPTSTVPIPTGIPAAPKTPDNGIQTARQNNGTYTGGDGKQYYNFDGTPVGSSSTTPTSFTSDATGADAAQQQIVADKAAAVQAAKDFNTAQANIQNGVTPLTAGQQAQIDSLTAQFNTLIDQQTLTNTGATGAAQTRGYQGGAAEYDPTFQAKTIGGIASAGAAKIATLQTQLAGAVASLTQSFKDANVVYVKNAYDALKTAQDGYDSELQSYVDKVQASITAAQAEADKQQQYQLDVAKFNQTGDQNAFDNALKTEQEKFTEEKTSADQSETARHDKATEAISAFNAGMGAGGGNTTGITQRAQLTPTGNPDPVSQKQVLDQITQKYGPMTATAIQGLANYSLNPADWSSRAGTKGLSRAQAVALAQMVDPTYNDAMYTVRATYMKNLASSQSGTVGSAINAANKSINHLTAFISATSQLPNGPIGLLNSFDNALTLNQGVKQNLTVANTEGLGVAEELAKFFKGSGTVDVASIDAWKQQVNANASPAQQKGLVQGAVTLLAGQLETLAEQYQNTMGKAPTSNFLDPSALANLSKLKNEGYTVDIPGVLYTDKAAYLKNDPEAQANMTAAITALQNAGLPITPENILQAAQSM